MKAMSDNIIYANNHRMNVVAMASIIIPIILGLIFLLIQRTMPALLLFAFPFIILVLCYPRMTLYLYILTLPIFLAPFTGSGILLIDLVSILLVAAFIVDFLLKSKVSLEIPGIAKTGLVLIFAMLLSAFFGYYPKEAISPISRVIFQVILIIVIYNLIRPERVQSTLKLYFWVMVGHSIFNVANFVFLGGSYRIFGLASVYFDDFSMLAIPIGLSFFLWSKAPVKSFLHGIGVIIVLFALIATQSRGPFLTAILVGLILTIMTARRARKENIQFIRPKIKLLLLGTILVAAIMLCFSGIFKDVGARFQSLIETGSGTIWLRISLWKTSLIAFMSNPITGIGSGNFRNIDLIFPHLKFDVARLYVMGLSAHNLFLHYLAETGLIGTIAMVYYFLKNFLNAKKIWVLSSAENYPAALALAGVGLTIFITIFYLDGWMWRQIAFIPPIFFALTARFMKGLADGE
jgi:O-antigen ligase